MMADKRVPSGRTLQESAGRTAVAGTLDDADQGAARCRQGWLGGAASLTVDRANPTPLPPCQPASLASSVPSFLVSVILKDLSR